ncbi:MAG: 3-hydroxyacyl-CoA dehydrogenase NAD-binding domain-containing protein [Pseudomonadota bacterium]
MKIEDVKTIAVLGAGDMGHGIAEAALMVGYKVFLRDVKPEFVDKGVTRINDSLAKLEAKGKIPAGSHEKIKNELLVPCVDLAEAVREADLVIEAVPEIMSLKKDIFAQVEAAAPSHALLASNTSTMRITEIAEGLQRPAQVLGLHYFNPAVLMKLVEVIKGEKTSEEAMEIGRAFTLKNNKVPVRVEKDVPGFIVNRVQAPAGVLLNCILDEGELDPESVDAVMRKLGMPMGPFETMDFAGLDIAAHGSAYFSQAIHPDFAIGQTIKKMVEAGLHGKKTGQGIFDWSAGRPVIDLSKATPKFDPMDMVAVNANEAMKIVELGACRMEDVDVAIIHGTGNPMGLLALVKGLPTEDLVARLEGLAKRYNKEIFKPAAYIRAGKYRG